MEGQHTSPPSRHSIRAWVLDTVERLMRISQSSDLSSQGVSRAFNPQLAENCQRGLGFAPANVVVQSVLELNCWSIGAVFPHHNELPLHSATEKAWAW